MTKWQQCSSFIPWTDAQGRTYHKILYQFITYNMSLCFGVHEYIQELKRKEPNNINVNFTLQVLMHLFLSYKISQIEWHYIGIILTSQFWLKTPSFLSRSCALLMHWQTITIINSSRTCYTRVTVSDRSTKNA